MKYRHFLIGATGLALIFATSCNRDLKSEDLVAAAPQETTASLENLYHRAVSLHDFSSASMILLELIEQQPDQAPRWKEEQAKMYFSGQNFRACEIVAKDLIEHHNGAGNTNLVEMLGVSQEATGNRRDALVTWNGLLEKGGSPAHAVRVAGLLINNNDLAKAKEVVDKALSGPDLDTFSVQLPVSPGRVQNVSAKAALNNLKGLISLKEDPKKNLEVARAAFAAALEQSPEFVIAKRNLSALNQAAPDPSAAQKIAPAAQ
jgi:hypothetical protein